MKAPKSRLPKSLGFTRRQSQGSGLDGSAGRKRTIRNTKLVIAANGTNKYVCLTHGEEHMTYKIRGDSAVVRTGNQFAILCSAETGEELAKLLAGALRERVGDTPPTGAQRLDDLNAALSDTFQLGSRPSRKVKNSDGF